MAAVFVVGYYLTYTRVRALMERLGVDDRDINDERLHWPINNWLAETGKLHILAGSIIHPSRGNDPNATKDGILFMTGFYKRRGIYDEREEDRKVKEWLVKEGGVNPEELQWMQMWDEFDMTLGGIVPKKNDFKGRLVFITLTAEEQQKYFECKDPEKFDSMGNFVDPERLARAKAAAGRKD
jgi:hypothetical protein